VAGGGRLAVEGGPAGLSDQRAVWLQGKRSRTAT
jgi:hypothetical protein